LSLIILPNIKRRLIIMRTYPGEPLNILHTIGLAELYPIIRCQIDFTQPLVAARLKQAVELVGQVVPQIFGCYVLQKNSFVVTSTDATKLIQYISDQIQPDTLPPDFMQGPQLKLYVQPQGAGQRLTIIGSHILTDGSGFKALLYLLADSHNRGAAAIVGKHNEQSIAPLEKLIAQREPVQQFVTDHPQEPLFLPQFVAHTPATYHVVGRHFSVAATTQLHAAAKAQQITLNDLFMAAFGQIMQQYSGVADLTLACPTDMRQFFGADTPGKLRIANFTARYNLVLRNTLSESLPQLVQAVHQQMQTLKKQQQFLDSVTNLLARAQTDSIAKLQQVAEANYHIRPIAYTNFGVVDAAQLQFNDTRIAELIMTGSFRRAPMFQVAVSTFADQATLAFSMIGSELEARLGEVILQQMQQNLLVWSSHN
jgi:NRPS condensation-like uncharacterized protein